MKTERNNGFQKKKWTPVLEPDVKEIDFRDIRLLSRLITERGRILPKKITGLTSKQQKMVARAIKRARQMSLLPFINYGNN